MLLTIFAKRLGQRILAKRLKFSGSTYKTFTCPFFVQFNFSCSITNKTPKILQWASIILIRGANCASEIAILPASRVITAWKCLYSEWFWSTFSCIRTESGETHRIFPYSAGMRENVDQNNSEYGHFIGSV